MNTIVYKTLELFNLILVAGFVLGGCAGQTPASPENKVNPTAQIDQKATPEVPIASSTPFPEALKEPPVPIEAAKDTAAVVVLVANQVTTLDPYRMITVNPEGSIASHIWDTLTHLNNDLQVEPQLAKSWQLLNDLTWEFKLRQGITFHNGELLNAEAVRFSVERANSLPGSVETFAQDVSLKRVEIVDDYTLQFVTNTPVPNLPYHLAFLEILPPAYYAETSPNRLAVAPVGSGPYRLEKWDQSNELILEAVPEYWQGTPTLSRLVFQTVPLVEDRLAALPLGQATLVTDLPPIRLDQWTSPGSRLAAIESTRRMFIGLHIERDSPLADKRVRHALNYGVNVKQLIDDWFAGYGEPYGSWVNPPSNNPEIIPWSYDPDLARKLLAEAGYRDGFTTTLRAPTDHYYHSEAIAQAVAQQLADIGVTVQIEMVDWPTYVQQLLSGDVAPLFLLGLNSRGDGLEDAQNLSSAFAFNPTGWRNETFENTLQRAASSFNESTRARLLNEAQIIAHDAAPWIWLWHPYDFYGIGQDFDWSPRRDGLVYLYKARE